MFVDRCKVFAKAGEGGNGCVSFRREKYVAKGGPDGGDGGKGGSVIFHATASEQSLVDLHYQQHQRAKHGDGGRGKCLHGQRGADRIAKVPLGTVIYDLESHKKLAELCEEGEEFMAAKGGKGGNGNPHFKSSVRRAPRIASPGGEGEERSFTLELKTIADIGLVGYPNAGKSTFLGAISNAHPKTAAYPFTTLYPIVGIVDFPDFFRYTMADIPGLIEGAHDNVGLGHAFLRHIERSKILIYVLDMSGVDGREPWDDLNNLKKELELYQEGLSDRACLIIANKMDEEIASEKLEILKTKTDLPIYPASVLIEDHIEEIVLELRRKIEEMQAEEEEAKRQAKEKSEEQVDYIEFSNF